MFNFIYYFSKFKINIERSSSKINNETISIYLKLFIVVLSRTEEEKGYRLYCHLPHNYRLAITSSFLIFLRAIYTHACEHVSQFLVSRSSLLGGRTKS